MTKGTLSKRPINRRQDRSQGSPSQSVVMHQQQLAWRGPIPSPESLKGFGDIDPAIPGLIVSMAVKEQEQKIFLEKFSAEEQSKVNSRLLTQGDRGQWFGLVVAMAGFVVAGIAVWRGQQWAASIIGGLDLTGLVAVFVYGSKRKNEQNKKQ